MTTCFLDYFVVLLMRKAVEILSFANFARCFLWPVSTLMMSICNARGCGPACDNSYFLSSVCAVAEAFEFNADVCVMICEFCKSFKREER